MELTVIKNDLKRFLNLISLSGENQIREALFDIKKDSISTYVKSPTGNIGLYASLKGEFIDFGETGIDDLELLSNITNIQDKEDITLKLKDNKLSIASTKTKASLILRSKEFIKNTPKKDDIEKYTSLSSGNEFNISKDDLDRILETYGLIKSETLKISSDNPKSVKFLFTRLDNEIETVLDVKKEIKPFKTTVNSYLLFLLKFLGEATLSIKQDVPAILIKHKKDRIETNYIFAPYGK